MDQQEQSPLLTLSVPMLVVLDLLTSPFDLDNKAFRKQFSCQCLDSSSSAVYQQMQIKTQPPKEMI